VSLSGRLHRRRALGALAVAPLAACGAAADRPLFAADTHPGDYPTVKAVKWMGEQVAVRSGGNLNIRQYPGGQLGEEKDSLELTIFGGIDINRVNLAPLNAFAPETIVPTLPFLFQSLDHMRRAMAGPPGDTILKALEPHGLVGLCFYESGARSLYTTNSAVRSPNDLKGRKIRVPNSDSFVAMIDALGGDATPMSYGEVYGALLQGVVDGAENNAPSYESSRHFEAAKFYSMTRHVMAPEVLVVSKRRWDRLPPQSQTVLRETAKESVGVMSALWAEREKASEARLRANNVTFVEDIDRPAFQAAVKPVWDRFLNTPQLKSLAAAVLAMETPS
jgi:tripartite ATP-independent transporter DctP family solute receptor